MPQGEDPICAGQAAWLDLPLARPVVPCEWTYTDEDEGGHLQSVAISRNQSHSPEWTCTDEDFSSVAISRNQSQSPEWTCTDEDFSSVANSRNQSQSIAIT